MSMRIQDASAAVSTPPRQAMAPVFIEVHGVFKSYTARDGAPVVAVDDVNLAIARVNSYLSSVRAAAERARSCLSWPAWSRPHEAT
jgi:hypothetical protein